MKTYRLSGTSGIDCLNLERTDVPKPGPGEVLVRMRAASLNYRDFMVINGRYARGKPKDMLVPLSDGAGEVAGIGEGVSRFKPGDRVVAAFMQSWISGGPQSHYNDSALGASIDGVLREYAVFSENGLAAVPAGLSFEEAATFPCAGVTAWQSLFEGSEARQGQTLLVQGSGGVSVFALQLAAATGLRIIATSSGSAKLRRLKELGAADTFNYRDDPDWERFCLEITGGKGVDHIVHVIGGDEVERSIRAMRHGGSIHLVSSGGSKGLAPALITRRSIVLRGIHVGSREMLEKLVGFYADHAIKPVIDRVFPFEEARQAYEYLKSASHFGKIVIAIP